MGTQKTVTAACLALGGVMGVAAPAMAAGQQRTVLVSVSDTGVQATGSGGKRLVTNARISGDGRYVAFESRAANLVGDDTNDSVDVFVRDTLTGITTRASVGNSNRQATRYSGEPSISADGRYVVFESLADNLVPGDTNENADVFLHDMLTGQTTRVSVAPGGAQGTTGDRFRLATSVAPVISADGRFVAFSSDATNLVPGDADALTDVFVRDLVEGTVAKVSVSADGGPADRSVTTSGLRISSDGRFVTFESVASNLVPGDTNGLVDVFVRDLVAGTTTRVNVANSGAQLTATQPGEASAVGGGRYVAFTSAATDVVTGDTNDAADVFVRDLVAGTTTRVSVASGGTPADRFSGEPAISADGRYVAFTSFADNLVAGDSFAVEVFVHDQTTGTTVLGSTANSGAHVDSSSQEPSISADGRSIAYVSFARNLVDGDANEREDAFLTRLAG